jgi:hypothetical protein
MTYIINRYANTGELTEEFDQIRQLWYDEPDDLTFGAWLRLRGVVEEHEGNEDDEYEDDYRVMKIVFKSESQFLAFKLKYL